jgi:hypothetical protein
MAFHDAYLIESYRDTKGKPRQRTVAYLGNIRQIDEHLPNIERELFLARARNVLETVRELSSEEREQIMDQLHRKVPPLTHNEVLLAFQQNLRWFFQWCDANNAKPPTADELQRIVSTMNRPPEPL